MLRGKNALAKVIAIELCEGNGPVSGIIFHLGTALHG